MSLLPVVVPRSSNQVYQQRLLHQIHSNQTSLQRLYDQLSTGRRVLSAADDPAAATRAIQLDAGARRAEQLVRTAGAAGGFLQTADAALGEVDQVLIEARGVTVSAAQGTLSDSERSSLVAEIDQALGRLVGIGNQSFRDTQLFGGALLSGASLVDQGDGIVFRGTDANTAPVMGRHANVLLLPSSQESLGLALPAAAGRSLNRALTDATRLTEMRSGRGVAAGVIRIGNGESWTDVDLRGAATLGDIRQTINSVSLDGRALEMEISTDGISLGYADQQAGILAVDDPPGGRTAADLGLRRPSGSATPPLVAEGLAPLATLRTSISELNGGAGWDLSAGIQISEGERVFEVDLAQAATVDDVLTAINRSGASVRAELDSSTEQIQLRFLKSGVDYSIGERGGSVASDLGLRSFTSDTRLSQLMRGRGPHVTPTGQPDLTLRRGDGSSLQIDASGLETIGQLIEAINQHPDNQDPLKVTVELTAEGNGLRLAGPSGTEGIAVSEVEGGNFGRALGWIAPGETEAQGQLSGSQSVLIGDDPVPVEAGGALDTLWRLRDAIQRGDDWDLQRLSGRLEQDRERSTSARGELGFRALGVEALQREAEDRVVALRGQYSQEVEADVTAVISQITSRQASMQASLQLMGQTAGLTLLNFL